MVTKDKYSGYKLVSKTAIQSISEFICRTSRQQHPHAAIERAKLAWLDTIGCILLGVESADSRIVRDCAAIWGEGTSPVIGTHLNLPPPWAAMVNAVAAHALEWDDYTFVTSDHPSAVLVPALLAAISGRERDVSGMALLDAYLIGLEVIFCLGEAG